MSTFVRRAVAVAALGAAVVTTLSACGSSKKSSASPSRSASATSNTRTVEVAITSDGCKPAQSSYDAGPLTFSVKNTDATAVNEIELLSGERIVGEKENLPAGFSGSFALSLPPGEYTLYCPGATTEKTTLKIIGTAATASASSDTSQLLAQGTKQYADYVNSQVSELIAAVKPLDTALKTTDLTAAQNAYKQARKYYERIEPVAESFTNGSDNLDSDIDARQDDVPANQWTGFHRIEKGLFQDNSLSGLAGYGDGLLANVAKLQTLTAGLAYQPAELANGAVDLLDEVSKTKITGEEERYSHIDLLDFSANVEGSEQAFACLEPALEKIDPTLTATITSAFNALDAALDKYRSNSDASGFVLYSTLTDADKTALSQLVQAVDEPLSTVASKVVTS
ncbi:MAG: peptidase M75 family protein [Actinobacteria bacterium]|nr:peptidase M75 family protein [Actinomycetota bacterium]